VGEAAVVLDCSLRTIYRQRRCLEEDGIQGLIHGNRGRPSPRKVSPAMTKRILALARGKYLDVNDTHMQELLAREQKIQIGRETLRALLRGAGQKPKRRRRKPKYRRRRERKEAMGIMLQIDASPHDWLEERGPWITLVCAKDDATGHVWAHFCEAETTWAYLDLMMDVFLSHGLPLSLYSDRHTIFHANRETTIVEQLKGSKPLTQFGRAMDELGIRIIKAWTPQAKGRIERHWGFLQDRLVVEMRLAGAKTIEDANAVLRRILDDYNQRFIEAPRNASSAFRKAPRRELLERILCVKETRTVNKDHTISVDGVIFQIPPSRAFHSIARKKVDVLQLKDGSLEIRYRDRTVAKFSPQAISRIIRSKPDRHTSLRAA